MTKQPVGYIANEARNLWKAGHSKNLINWVLWLVGAARRPEVIYIAEHETGDWDTANCTGNPVTLWAYRGDDFIEIAESVELDENAIASRTPVIRYCLEETGQRMIHNRWNGYRAGYGCLLRRTGGKWESDGRRWIS